MGEVEMVHRLVEAVKEATDTSRGLVEVLRTLRETLEGRDW